MNLTIRLTMSIILTSLTGSLGMIICLIAGRKLLQWGFVRGYYNILRAVTVLFIIPAAFVVIYFLEKVYMIWDGYLMLYSPFIVSFSKIFSCLWGTGFCVSILKMFYQLWYIHREKKDWFACDRHVEEIFYGVCHSMEISGKKTGLYQSYRISVPQINGILKPCIILPAKDLQEDALQVIFTHELTHFRQKDILIKRIWMLAFCINFFNPFIQILYREICMCSELACDVSSCQRIGSIKKYFLVITDIAENTGKIQSIFSSGLMENRDELN